MNSKKFFYIFLGITLVTTIGSLLFTAYIKNKIANPDNLNSLINKTGFDLGIDSKGGNKSLIGEQPPQWQSGDFSPDGRYYAYTYSISNVISYSSRIGSRAKVTQYLQVLDTHTGAAILSEPIRFQRAPTIMDIENKNVWLSCYNYVKDAKSAELYVLGDKSLKFGEHDLVNLNPDMRLLKNSSVLNFIQNNTGNSGAVIEAADGRQYLINPGTGKITKASSQGKRLSGKNERNAQTSPRVNGYSSKGGSRKYIIPTAVSGIRSEQDYIDPRFLVLNKSADLRQLQPTLYNNHLFILSSLMTIGEKDRQLSMLDATTLKNNWTIDLPQNPQVMETYECESFFLKDNRMYLANKSTLFKIDLDHGKIIQSTSLYPTK